MNNKYMLLLGLILGCSHVSRVAAWEYAIRNETGSQARFQIDQKWDTGSGNFWVDVPAKTTKTFKAGEKSWVTHIQKGDTHQEANKKDVTTLVNWKGKSGWEQAAHGYHIGTHEGTFVYSNNGFEWLPNGWSKTDVPKIQYPNYYDTNDRQGCRECVYNKWSKTLRCNCPYNDNYRRELVCCETKQATCASGKFKVADDDDGSLTCA